MTGAGCRFRLCGLRLATCEHKFWFWGFLISHFVYGLQNLNLESEIWNQKKFDEEGEEGSQRRDAVFAFVGCSHKERTKGIVGRREVQTKKQRSINPRMANPQIDNDGRESFERKII